MSLLFCFVDPLFSDFVPGRSILYKFIKFENKEAEEKISFLLLLKLKNRIYL